MKTYDIAVIPGDGIGVEVMPEALRVLERVADVCGFGLKFRHYDWNCETWLRTGQMMPDDGLDQLSQSASILLGAVGFPSVPDHISLWGLLIPIRREFHQYVNLRPVRLLPGIPCPLANKKPGDIDFWMYGKTAKVNIPRLAVCLVKGHRPKGRCRRQSSPVMEQTEFFGMLSNMPANLGARM